MAKSKYNWPDIEAEYVTGTASLRDLASKHGCGERTIMQRSTSGGWEAKRQQHRSALAQSQTQAKTAYKALDKAMFDNLIDQGIDIAATIAVRDLTNAFKLRASIDALELKTGVATLLLCQEAKYRSLGIPLKQAVEHSGQVNTEIISSEKASEIKRRIIEYAKGKAARPLELAAGPDRAAKRA